MQGAMSSGIGVVVTENGAQVTATVSGIVGAFMTLGLGTNTLAGTLTGNQASMTASGHGSGHGRQLRVHDERHGGRGVQRDTMQGRVTYTRVPVSGNAGCASFVSCHYVQNFSGTRPPSAT